MKIAARPKVPAPAPLVIRKEDESMGEFMSRIVTTFEKENKKRPRKRALNALENSVPRERSVPKIMVEPGKPLSLEEQIMNDMLLSYQHDRDLDKPQQQELLNYDVLLRTNRIIKRVLMPPPRFKDDFFFTHLYQEDQTSPKLGRGRRKRGTNRTTVTDPSVRFNSGFSSSR